MQPGRYTELFFLDEATALSAGHRPCGMCRKREHVSFKFLWLAANGYPPDLKIAAVDKILHAERIDRGCSGNWVRAADSLPPGVIVEFDGGPHLWDGRSLRRWTATGYGADIKLGELPPLLQLLSPP